jgi:hypothetical protein
MRRTPMRPARARPRLRRTASIPVLKKAKNGVA